MSPRPRSLPGRAAWSEAQTTHLQLVQQAVLPRGGPQALVPRRQRIETLDAAAPHAPTPTSPDAAPAHSPASWCARRPTAGRPDHPRRGAPGGAPGSTIRNPEDVVGGPVRRVRPAHPAIRAAACSPPGSHQGLDLTTLATLNVSGAVGHWELRVLHQSVVPRGSKTKDPPVPTSAVRIAAVDQLATVAEALYVPLHDPRAWTRSTRQPGLGRGGPAVPSSTPNPDLPPRGQALPAPQLPRQGARRAPASATTDPPRSGSTPSSREPRAA